MMTEYLYPLLFIIAPALLAIGLFWVTTHNKLSARQKAESEAATRQLYKEQGEEDRRREGE